MPSSPLRPLPPSRPPETELDLLTELDRIEDLIDELDELGLASRDEAEARRLALHHRLDALEDSAR